MTSPAAVDVADLLVDKLTWQLASTRAKVVLRASKLHDLEEVSNTAKRVHENLFKKLRIETKTYEERIGCELDGAIYRYHGMLRSV